MDIGPDVGLWSYLLLVPENPREPRQWTEEVGRMGNKEPSQLVPPTHKQPGFSCRGSFTEHRRFPPSSE